MQQIAFGGWAPPGPARGAYRSPSWIKESLLLREGDGNGVEEYGMGRGGRRR